MVTVKEKENIMRGFENILIGIDRMLAVIEKYELKKEIVIKLVNSINPAKKIEAKCDMLFEKKDELLQLKESFNGIPEIENNITDQFKTFLQSQVMMFNSEQKYLLQSHLVNRICAFLDEQDTGQLSVSSADSDMINYIENIPEQYNGYITSLIDIKNKFHVFWGIRNIEGSIVMVGANGSGKSTFARTLKGKLASNIAILSAQHFLFYQKQETIPAGGDEIGKVRNFQSNSKLGTDGNITYLMTSDMNDLIAALMAEHTDCSFALYDHGNRKDSYLVKTIKLWNEIIEHREIKVDRTGLYVTGHQIKQYDFNQLSDGEKAVFYYIAHILLACDNSYIVVDEPENHLHLTICNKLWDALERERKDCKFIYLTHNLNFATSRSDCTVLWNKKFTPPFNWDFEVLPENSTIPEILIMELAGSRKNICFCEGNDRSSIDYKLYSVLFPEYTVVPVEGHRNVIDYVEAYNSMPSFVTKAIGIIDGDHHLPTQVQKWKGKKIYTLPINEVENILCDEHIMQKAVEVFCAGDYALESFKTEFWNLLANNIEEQAVRYINEYINNRFKENFLHEKRDLENLIEELNKITSDEEIRELYTQIVDKLNDFILRKDYAGAITFVNFKGQLTRDKARKTIVDKYENRILDLIKKDKELQDYILKTYFVDFEFLN